MQVTILTVVGLLAALAPVRAADGQFAWLDEAPEDEFVLVCGLNVTGGWQDADEARLIVHFRDEANFICARLLGGKAQFVRVADGTSEELGSGGALPSGQAELCLRRRRGSLILVADGKAICRAAEYGTWGGKVGYWLRGDGVTLEEPGLQELGEISFADNFMREAFQVNSWEPLSGSWYQQGLPSSKTEVQKTANPFSCRARADEQALTAAGYWFWDDYSFTAAARADKDGAFGLALRAHDGDNFYAFRWCRGLQEAGRRVDAQQLIKVVDGQVEVLAENPGPYGVKEWYRITLRAAGTRLEALVEDTVVLEAEDETFAQGRAALYAAQCQQAYFDDAEAESWTRFADRFASGLGAWEVVAGSWEGKPGLATGHGSADEAALVISGGEHWRSYIAGAQVSPGSAQSIGVVGGYRDRDNYYVFRGTRPGKRGGLAKWEIVCVADGESKVVGTGLASWPGTKTAGVALELGGGRLVGRVFGTAVVDVADITHLAGRWGLMVGGPRTAQFREAVVEFLPPPPPPAPVTEQFTREGTMSDWARPAGLWYQGVDGRWWSKTLIFNDVLLSLRLPSLPAGAHVSVLLTDDAGADDYTAITVRPGAQSGLQCSVEREDQTLAAASVTCGPQPLLTVDKRGRSLVASLDGEPVVCATDGAPMRGGRVAVHLEGCRVSLNGAVVQSTHLRDYTFSRAPTAWRSQYGIWEVTSRWSCSPGWAWFGGRGHKSPLLWTKQSFSGDQTLDIWAALGMDLDRGPGYSHPSDINATICGDGENLCSGYSFILAGENNTSTMLLKGTKVVAQNPEMVFTNPTSGNMGFHRHWFHVRVEKLGPKLTMYVDDQRALQWTDPEPLDGGHIGFWSYQANRPLIARAMVSYERGR